MEKMLTRLIILLFSLIGFQSIAQIDSNSTIEIDTAEYVQFFKVDNLEEIEELNFEQDTVIALKEKKKKRRVYYGKKTKKGFTKTVKGKDVIIEVFHYLKVWEEPNKYIKDIYWYDINKTKITRSKKYTKEGSKILHGPYKKMINDIVIEEGIYYVGTKHGRWVTYAKPKDYKFRIGDRDRKVKKEIDGVVEKVLVHGSDTILNYQLLTKKEYYNRGWSKFAKLKYYDPKKTKLKEVVPFDIRGKNTGDYYLYFENGKIKMRGALINGKRVGKWTEYQLLRGKVRKLRVTTYPAFPEEEDPKGELTNLWNKKGALIYDKRRGIDKRKK